MLFYKRVFFILLDYDKKLLVITAPSGSGKTSLINLFLQRNPSFAFSVSHTTRNPRDKEKEGKDYFFVNNEFFEKKIKANFFLEWAKVYQHYYGTSIKEIEDKTAKGKKIILDIDVQGGLYLQKKIKGLFVFIRVKNPKVLKKRLLARGDQDLKIIEKRLEIAKKELNFFSKWPHVIMNDTNLLKALKSLEKLVKNHF